MQGQREGRQVVLSTPRWAWRSDRRGFWLAFAWLVALLIGGPALVAASYANGHGALQQQPAAAPPPSAWGCGPAPIPPIPPIGCARMVPQCECDASGRACRWMFVCVPSGRR